MNVEPWYVGAMGEAMPILAFVVVMFILARWEE